MSVLAYEGPATVTSGRTELALNVQLYVEAEPVHLGDEAGVLRSWRGDASTTDWSSDFLGHVTIRLPNGGEAKAAITSARYEEGSAHLVIAGNGEPPFAWEPETSALSQEDA